MAVRLCRGKFGLPCVFIVSYLVVVVGYGVLSYISSRKSELEQIDESLRLVASQIKFILPRDFHDRAVGENSISKKEDASNVDKLSEYVLNTTATYGVTHIYTLVVVDGTLRMTASSRSAEERAEAQGTPYFIPLGAPPPSVLKALRSNQPVVTTHLNDVTSARSLLLPEKSPGGKTYLACSEMASQEIERRLDANMWHSLTTSGFFVLLAIPLVLIFRKTDKTHAEEFESIRELLHNKALNRTSVIERKLNEFIARHKPGGPKEKNDDKESKQPPHPEV